MFNKSTKHYRVGFPEDVNIDEIEKDKPLPKSNSLLYDHDKEGSACFLDQEWVKQKFQTKFIVQLKQQPNRSHPIPDYVSNSILGEMQRL